MNGKTNRQHGFTLIELMVVMAIIGSLMALVAPNYFQNSVRAKETVLRHNLFAIRGAIDDYHLSKGQNPNSLEELVSARYLRELPLDPISGRRDSWLPQMNDEPGMADVKSGAEGVAQDGSEYASW